MAIGTITVAEQQVKAASAPIQVAALSFAGDAAYPTGGTAGIRALVQAALKRQDYILGVVPLALNGGYDAVYDRANDKLIVKAGNTQVVNNTDLSGTTFVLGFLMY